ncbi:MAG TPA: hypothetical protein VD966_10440 [Pyrinomonadaceae bacterium]|nr:hypothetical protein [Pyrinomonadaceae bacterium]
MRKLEIKSLNLHLSSGLLLFFLLLSCALGPAPCAAQTVVDKMVATVDSGGRPSLITYSDIIWQMALEPETPLAKPTSEALNRALQRVINQRLILLEAERLPTIVATEEEIKNELAELVNQFPPGEFQRRAERAGLSRVQLEEIIRQRVEINKYLNFRFRSFIVVTPKEVEDYYSDVYVPRLRRRQPGRIVPQLDEVRSEIESRLTESKIESEMDAFLDGARDRAEILILNPV